MWNKVEEAWLKARDNDYKGLLLPEWLTILYMAITSVIILILYHDMTQPLTELKQDGMLLIGIGLLWLLHRVYPCRLLNLARVTYILLALKWLYDGTYEINKVFDNMDHYFASAEQWLFHCQPSLLFSVALPQHIVSELFDMGYFMYYPMIALTILFFFCFRQKDFEKASFVILGGFFLYYLIFIFLPVTGPTYYFKAIGLNNAMNGVFPPLGNYFLRHQECLPSPGYTNGFFYRLVELAKESGERPTAAFPSSHVGVSTLCMMLAVNSKSKSLTLFFLPFYILLCCATVYIQAHYLIDAIFGFVSAVLFYFLLTATYNMLISKRRVKNK